MGSKETERKTIPFVNGLFERTAEVYKAPVKAPDRCPTYNISKENFAAFVLGLERLATRAAKLFKNAQPKFMVSNGDVVNYSVSYGLGSGNWNEFVQNCKASERGDFHAFYEKYKKFRHRYIDFFSTVCIQQNGATFFNLEFIPRGKERNLFLRFIKAYLQINALHRLNMQGPKTGPRTIPPDLAAYALQLYAKGKSIAFVARAVMGKLKYPTAPREIDPSIFNSYQKALSRLFRKSNKHSS